MLNPALLPRKGHALTSALPHRGEKREASAKHGLQEVVNGEV